jgi:formylglycine-generating enzyme required for sulfatase activity
MIAGMDPCCRVRQEMVRIPAGQFLMGDHHGDGHPHSLPVHVVNLDVFYMDVYENGTQAG